MIFMCALLSNEKKTCYGGALYQKDQALFSVCYMYTGERLHYIVRRNSSLATAPASPD